MDMEEGQIVPEVKVRKKRRDKPTLKQIKALQYKNQGMSTRKAMMKAGYGDVAANHPGKHFWPSKGVQTALASFKGEVIDQGLNTKYMAAKFKEWLEATKVQTSHTEPDRKVPDYDVQIKAYDRWGKIMEDKPLEGKIKRQMTVTEFVFGEKEGDTNA